MVDHVLKLGRAVVCQPDLPLNSVRCASSKTPRPTAADPTSRTASSSVILRRPTVRMAQPQTVLVQE